MPKCKVRYWSILIMMLMFFWQGCNRFDLDDYDFVEKGESAIELLYSDRLEVPLDTSQLKTLKDSSSILASIEKLSNDRKRVNHLIYYAEGLKNYQEVLALFCADKAYAISTSKNWNIPRIVSAHRIARLKGRRATYGEDIEDAMVEAKISQRLMKNYNHKGWELNIAHLFGYLLMKDGQPEKARSYFKEALGKVERVNLTPETMKWNKAALLHDIALTFPTQDSASQIVYFNKSDSLFTLINNTKGRAFLLYDLALFYYRYDDLSKADSLFNICLEYGHEYGDLQMLADVYREKAGLSRTLFGRYRQESDLEKTLKYIDLCQKYEQDSQYRTYDILGNLFHHYWVMKYNSPMADSLVRESIFYYKKAIDEAFNEGAINTLQKISKNLAQGPCKYRKEICDEVLGNEVSIYLNDIYTQITSKVINRSRGAFQRINKVENRDIEVREAVEKQNIIYLGLSILFLSVVIFVFSYQRQQNKRLKAQMVALRAQINPHFMSNSLNAIESLVNLGKTRDASKYLIHFSRLTRKILTESEADVISLKEETSTLKHFFALEQLRFRDQLTYDIQIAPEITPELVAIPSLTLQPYIENAIWHGLKPKPNGGHIQIDIEKEGKILICTITDNGIGRERARAMQNRSVLKHKSMGMQITENRLKAMGRIKGVNVEVQDLKTDTGEPLGTKVIIRIPYRHKR